jgi:hypothetical protein
VSPIPADFPLTVAGRLIAHGTTPEARNQALVILTAILASLAPGKLVAKHGIIELAEAVGMDRGTAAKAVVLLSTVHAVGVASYLGDRRIGIVLPGYEPRTARVHTSAVA